MHPRHLIFARPHGFRQRCSRTGKLRGTAELQEPPGEKKKKDSPANLQINSPKAAAPRSTDVSEEAGAVMSLTHSGSSFSGNESWKQVKCEDLLGNCVHPLPMQQCSLQYIFKGLVMELEPHPLGRVFHNLINLNVKISFPNIQPKHYFVQLHLLIPISGSM